ncbi:MAG: DUF2517 family protein [Aeromonadaceae bacterium]
MQQEDGILAKRFSLLHLFLRRLYVCIVGFLAFPFVCWYAPWRKRLYSLLFRVWYKRAREPVWLTRVSECADLFV